MRAAQFLSILIGFLSISAFALETKVIELEAPDHFNSDYSVYLASGEIVNLAATNDSLVEKVKEAAQTGVTVKVELKQAPQFYNMRSELEGLEVVATIKTKNFTPQRPFFKSTQSESPLLNTYVTDFDSQEELNEIFLTQRRDTSRWSQCYNRAHVWSWEIHKKERNGQKIQTGKMWVFFTRKYIKEYKFKWWFHIAPYATVKGEDRVLDRSFTKEPVSREEWTHEFVVVKPKVTCPEITKYSQYDKENSPEYCYVMKTSQFYWQPYQIKNVEETGEERSEWVYSELKRAYRNGIGFFARVR